MKRTKAGVKGMTDAATIRASISFPHTTYEGLVRIAKDKKVSLAWVVREAADQYISTEAKEGKGTRSSDEVPVRKVRRRS